MKRDIVKLILYTAKAYLKIQAQFKPCQPSMMKLFFKNSEQIFDRVKSITSRGVSRSLGNI